MDKLRKPMDAGTRRPLDDIVRGLTSRAARLRSPLGQPSVSDHREDGRLKVLVEISHDTDHHVLRTFINSLAADSRSLAVVGLLYVIPSHWFDPVVAAHAGPMWAESRAETFADAETLAVSLSYLVPSNVACNILVRCGRPARVMRRECKQSRYDLVVLTHRLKG
jgi:hypothetical protein